jgi:GNAT superfamily N-acetyltransferase
MSAMDISKLEISIKASLSSSELADAGDLVAEANWNQTEDDWKVFVEHGRVYAARTPGGRIVATTASLPYGDRFAWISMVLVAGAWRRRGLATRLMRRATDDLAVARLVPVLDATPDGRAVYRNLGYQDCWGFYRLKRAQRRGAAPAEPAGITVDAIKTGDWARICAFDAAAFGADRNGVLSGLRGRLPAAELMAQSEGRLVGFCLGRNGRIASHIGPLVAETDGVACAILSRALKAIEGLVLIDLADAKSAVRLFLEERGFGPVRPFTRMIHGSSQRFDDAARTFAVIGPEFG